jgi:hypothetical protein
MQPLLKLIRKGWLLKTGSLVLPLKKYGKSGARDMESAEGIQYLVELLLRQKSALTCSIKQYTQ